MKELKIVIDSNIFVSILKGCPGFSAIYTAFKEGRFKLVISADMLKELAAVLYRPCLQIDSENVKELFRLIKLKAIMVKPKIILNNICRDAKDNFIFEMAIEARAIHIISGDKDILELKPSYKGVSILTPSEFLNLLKIQPASI